MKEPFKGLTINNIVLYDMDQLVSLFFPAVK